MCLWLLGEREPGRVEVTAQVALPDPKMGIPMDLSILIRTASDALVSVNMSYNSHLNLYDYLVMGHEKSLVISGGKLTAPEGVLLDAAGQPYEQRGTLAQQDREFLAAIREGRPAAISAESVLPAMWVLQQVQDAWEAWRPTGAAHPLPAGAV
jgi:predicted dehydrogenase